ncbi:DUF3023 domain-containing protein [Ehrlichia ruminantium]|uniref:Uncharacterized protein n=1 Tax=Ehrlichia ruminantium (strain Welgevonden) TaxID=254945 RepID=A0A0H3M1G7_EHRRW|nr:DUF3023 domain-containing protein [Ehrlichia ruminantium]QLK56152.1 DUF3023 domain-containing protein [Ehrlichia ruminantium]UOD99361.1 DUF3023 domain-containing protein [Ehrlichia ruminantium]CAH58288.1 hypothetical protein Erum5590 [Ehrlichia ruminantium str. Welgevonden]CAI27080.1 Hypothetical protein ERWE_CDS_05860 [Ehrlichia ruminantium str. Welgevonden]
MLLNNSHIIPETLSFRVLKALRHIEKLQVKAITCIGHTHDRNKLITLNQDHTVNTSHLEGESIVRVLCTVSKKRILRNPDIKELHDLVNPGVPVKPLNLTIYCAVNRLQHNNFTNIFPNTNFTQNSSGVLKKPVKVVTPTETVGYPVLFLPTNCVLNFNEAEALREAEITSNFQIVRDDTIVNTQEQAATCCSLLSCTTTTASTNQRQDSTSR